jgi:hypothetical protein
VGGSDLDRRTALSGSGLTACHEGPLRHDWNFRQRTYCRTSQKVVHWNVEVPRAVFEAPEGNNLLISLRRADAPSPTTVELHLGQHILQVEADAVWNEQRFTLPAHSLPKGTVRAELVIPAGVRLELDHLLLVPMQHSGSLAVQQGG